MRQALHQLEQRKKPVPQGIGAGSRTSHAAEAGGPGLIGFHHGVIQAYGEKDQFVLLAFFLERRFNLFFHPGVVMGKGPRSTRGRLIVAPRYTRRSRVRSTVSEGL